MFKQILRRRSHFVSVFFQISLFDSFHSFRVVLISFHAYFIPACGNDPCNLLNLISGFLHFMQFIIQFLYAGMIFFPFFLCSCHEFLVRPVIGREILQTSGIRVWRIPVNSVRVHNNICCRIRVLHRIMLILKSGFRGPCKHQQQDQCRYNRRYDTFSYFHFSHFSLNN